MSSRTLRRPRSGSTGRRRWTRRGTPAETTRRTGESQRAPSSISSYPPTRRTGSQRARSQSSRASGRSSTSPTSRWRSSCTTTTRTGSRTRTSSSTTPTSSPSAGCRPPTRWSSTAASRSSPRSGGFGS